MAHKWRVLIADDHALMAEGLASILSTAYEIVGISADGRQLIADALSLQPDVICLDIGMPGLNGLQAAVEVHRVLPKVKLVFVTQQVELPYLRAAFRAGGSGYVAKQSAGSELLKALACVLDNRTYVTPLLAGEADGDPHDLLSDPDKVFVDALTPRQREVLQLIAEGRTAKEISVSLNISPKTVEFHKSCVMDELGLRTTAELTRYAITHGIVSSGASPGIGGVS